MHFFFSGVFFVQCGYSKEDKNSTFLDFRNLYCYKNACSTTSDGQNWQLKMRILFFLVKTKSWIPSKLDFCEPSWGLCERRNGTSFGRRRVQRVTNASMRQKAHLGFMEWFFDDNFMLYRLRMTFVLKKKTMQNNMIIFPTKNQFFKKCIFWYINSFFLLNASMGSSKSRVHCKNVSFSSPIFLLL